MSIGVLTWPGETQLTVIWCGPNVRARPRHIVVTPPLVDGVRHRAAEAAGPPALRAEQDDPATLALPRSSRCPRRRARKKADLRLMSCWKSQSSSVTSSSDPAAAARRPGSPGRRVAELGARSRDERVVGRQVAQVGDDADVAGAVEPADHLVEPRLVEVDRHDLRAGRCEAARDGRADAPGRPGQDDAAPSRPAPTLHVISRSLLVRRRLCPVRPEVPPSTFSLR